MEAKIAAQIEAAKANIAKHGGTIESEKAMEPNAAFRCVYQVLAIFDAPDGKHSCSYNVMADGKISVHRIY